MIEYGGDIDFVLKKSFLPSFYFQAYMLKCYEWSNIKCRNVLIWNVSICSAIYLKQILFSRQIAN
jgi:hypothetical protein